MADPTTLTINQIAAITSLIEADWTEGTIADLALRLHHLRQLQSAVRKVEQAVEDTLVDSMETDDEQIPGLGALHRSERNTSAWKFKHSGEQLREDLSTAVANNIATDVATGDIDPMKRNVARATMKLALEAIPAFSTLNKPGRERLGLRIYDYREFATSYRITIEATEVDG